VCKNNKTIILLASSGVRSLNRGSYAPFFHSVCSPSVDLARLRRQKQQKTAATVFPRLLRGSTSASPRLTRARPAAAVPDAGRTEGAKLAAGRSHAHPTPSAAAACPPADHQQTRRDQSGTVPHHQPRSTSRSSGCRDTAAPWNPPDSFLPTGRGKVFPECERVLFCPSPQ